MLEGVQMNICTIRNIELMVRTPDFSANNTEILCLAVEESQLLAHSAYTIGNSAQFAVAERILHIIHSHHSYAQPTHPVLSIIWNSLYQAKMSKLMSEIPQVEPLSKDEFVEQMQIVLAEIEGMDRHFMDLVTLSRSKTALAYYTKNWFNAISGFDQQLTSLLIHVKQHPLQKSIAENLSDEYCDEVPHYEVRLQWCDAVGVDLRQTDRIRDTQILTESFAIQSFRTGISFLRDPSFCLGLFYSIEALHPRTCDIVCKNLRAWGFDEQALNYWRSHGTMDEDHAAEWLSALLASDLTPQQYANAISGAYLQLNTKGKLFHAMTAEVIRILQQESEHMSPQTLQIAS